MGSLKSTNRGYGPGMYKSMSSSSSKNVLNLKLWVRTQYRVVYEDNRKNTRCPKFWTI